MAAPKELGWKELAEGDVLKAGTAVDFHTGDWRSKRPVKDDKTCINCMFCYVYCPDSAIKLKDGKIESIDLDFCKGCGICENVCPVKPVKSIKMVPER